MGSGAPAVIVLSGFAWISKINRRRRSTTLVTSNFSHYSSLQLVFLFLDHKAAQILFDHIVVELNLLMVLFPPNPFEIEKG